MDIAAQEDALRRSFTRLAAQEVRRQLNMESIVAEAGKCQVAEVSSQPVAEDWAAAFFESCQDVSDAELQNIWGKLLAGEVGKPGTVSKMLLNAVRLMSTENARNFSLLCRESFTGNPNFPESTAPVFFMRNRTFGFNLEIEISTGHCRALGGKRVEKESSLGGVQYLRASPLTSPRPDASLRT